MYHSPTFVVSYTHICMFHTHIYHTQTLGLQEKVGLGGTKTWGGREGGWIRFTRCW
jgi:hypothetical protein